MATVVNGLVGGAVGTVVMTVLMMALGDDSPPPTAAFWAKYVGDEGPESYMMQGMVLHFVYGILAGAVFVVVANALPATVSLAGLTAGLLWGAVWGVVLFVGAAVFWMRLVLGMEAEMAQVGMFLGFHLAYGLVLGAWLGAGPLL